MRSTSIIQCLFVTFLVATALEEFHPNYDATESANPQVDKLQEMVFKLMATVERLQRDLEELRAPGTTTDTNFIASCS